MRTALLFVALLLSSFSWSHEYFFAFAEVEYNTADKRLEITFEGSAHDVEDVLNETGIPIKELEDHYKDKEMLSKIEDFINKGFQFRFSGITPNLELLGMEVKPNGMVYFYLRSSEVALGSSVEVRFDWLMDVFEKQQNKVTFIVNEKKHTAVFLANKRTETITF